MNIGIVGSRRRNSVEDFNLVNDKFCEIILYLGNDENVSIISGGCPSGGDAFAEKIASHYKLPIIIHYPDKSKLKSHSRWEYTKINYERNTIIAKESDILIACVAVDRKGGTEDTIKKFLKFGKTELYLV